MSTIIISSSVHTTGREAEIRVHELPGTGPMISVWPHFNWFIDKGQLTDLHEQIGRFLTRYSRATMTEEEAIRLSVIEQGRDAG